MNFSNLQLVLSWCLVLGTSCNAANAQGDPTFGYKLQRNVVYGEGLVAPEGEPVSRELQLDSEVVRNYVSALVGCERVALTRTNRGSTVVSLAQAACVPALSA